MVFSSLDKIPNAHTRRIPRGRRAIVVLCGAPCEGVYLVAVAYGGGRQLFHFLVRFPRYPRHGQVVAEEFFGGLAAGFAIAGAALAVTSLVLNETGAMDKMIEGLAEHLQEKYGWDKNKAMLAASLIINISIMVLQLGCSIGSMVAGIAAAGKAAADAAATGAKVAGEAAKISAATLQTARQVQTGITVANTGVGVVSLGTGALTTYRSFMADSSKADTTELEKFMTMLQQRLEESQEELQKILEQIQSGIGELAQMIGSATDTSAEIAQNIGQMA